MPETANPAFKFALNDGSTRESSTDNVAVAVPSGAASDPTSGRKSKAQSAFQSGDVAASIAAHTMPSAELHDTGAGEYIKAIVFGGLDGIITTFAVVASAAGAGLSTDIILVMGFSNLFADGVSMGFGEYLSGDAEMQFAKQEHAREKWEMENNPQGEIDEMIEIYEEKGFSKEDATVIISTMAKNPKFFVDHMCVEELGMMAPDEDDSPLKQGGVMFASFIICGLVPLLAYLAFSTIDSLSPDDLFGIAIALTAMALFALGAFSSKFTTSSWYVRGTWVLLNGATAAAVAYGVGYLVESIVELDESGCSGTSTLPSTTTSSL